MATAENMIMAPDELVEPKKYLGFRKRQASAQRCFQRVPR
jgi:hypothetical protein